MPEPGYTVITRSMSAAFPISSVMAVDGVSGEMAMPARIPRWCIVWMRDIGSARNREVRSEKKTPGLEHTGSFVVETIEGASRVCDVVHPLKDSLRL